MARCRAEGVLEHVEAPTGCSDGVQGVLDGGHAIFHRLDAVIFGERHLVGGDVHLKVGGRFKPRAKQVFVAVMKAVEGSPKEAPGVPSCGGHAPSDAAEPFMASAAESVKRGVCPPARTARFIASQLWGLTHVQGLSVRPVGWLGVIRTSSEDP